MISDYDEREVVGDVADGAVEVVSSFFLSVLLERKDVWVRAKEGEVSPQAGQTRKEQRRLEVLSTETTNSEERIHESPGVGVPGESLA